MPVDPLGRLHLKFLKDHPEYSILLEHETFDIIRSRTMGAAATRLAAAA